MRRATACLAALLVAAETMAPARAQLGELLKKVVPGAAGTDARPDARPPDASSAAGTRAAPPDPTEAKYSASLKSSGATAPALTKEGKAKAGDIVPDRQCTRPTEKFDIFEKAVEYGGAEAEARLQRLIDSDMRYDELTPEDRALLKFVAQTTVWVPVEVENRIVSIGGMFGSRGHGETPELEERRIAVETRVKRIRATLSDFPTEIVVRIDPAQADGAYAKYGGEIVIANDFTEQMEEHPVGGDFVLAHELSHVYKRHPIKKLQFTLVSSNEGWKLGRKLLARAGGSNSSRNPLADAAFFAIDAPKLYGVIKTMQLSFSREQELEADACTAIWLSAIGDDPAPAWKDFATHYAATDKAVISEYGATHPPTEERAANFQTKLKGGKGATKIGDATRKSIGKALPTKP